MHNTLTRLQTTFSHLTTLAFSLAFLISALSLLTPPSSHSDTPRASLAVRNVQVVRGRPHYYSPKREEYAHIRFDLDAELSGLFGWNTKQVFVYVSAEYPAIGGGDKEGGEGRKGKGDGQEGVNKAVIWDTIIPAPATRWSYASVKERWFPAKIGKGKGGKGARRSSTAKSTSGGDKGKEKKTTDMTKPGLLVLKNQKPKYQITDPSGVISVRPNATLTLSWNVQPWVGPLLWDRGMLEDKNGAVSAARSWNLPFLKHQWRGGVLPRSERFDFPPLKGTKKTDEVVKDKDGPRTPEPAEASVVV